MSSIHEELLHLAEDTVVGELMRPALAHRLHTQLRAYLLRKGERNAQVHITTLKNGFQVSISLARPRARVEAIRFSIGLL